MNVQYQNFQTRRRIYIVDFFNIFSDFREIKYKKSNIDFHNVKQRNKQQDTSDFFELFFTKYIQYMNIQRDSRFIFIMKKLNEYESILEDLVRKYHVFDIKLIIIEDKYHNDILDKNKDDFLCQYIFYILQQKYNVDLISNDKYRDRQNYVSLFTFDILTTSISWNNKLCCLEKSTCKLKVNNLICNNLMTQKCKRCSIPKHKLDVIM